MLAKIEERETGILSPTVGVTADDSENQSRQQQDAIGVLNDDALGGMMSTGYTRDTDLAPVPILSITCTSCPPELEYEYEFVGGVTNAGEEGIATANPSSNAVVVTELMKPPK